LDRSSVIRPLPSQDEPGHPVVSNKTMSRWLAVFCCGLVLFASMTVGCRSGSSTGRIWKLGPGRPSPPDHGVPVSTFTTPDGTFQLIDVNSGGAPDFVRNPETDMYRPVLPPEDGAEKDHNLGQVPEPSGQPHTTTSRKGSMEKSSSTRPPEVSGLSTMFSMWSSALPSGSK